MRIVIPNNAWIVFDGINVEVENALLKRFSVRHPKARFLDSATWDGWYKRYYVDKQAMARPFLKEVRELLNGMQMPYEVLDGRDAPKHVPDESQVMPDLLPGITLEGYQMDALRAMCREECGIISSTTGSGKTEIMAGIAKLVDAPTVIIADIRVVIEQIKERLELRDVDGGEIGLFYAGERPNGHKIVVGSIQSLSTPTRPDPETKDRHGKFIYKDEEGKFLQEKYDKAITAYKTRLRGAREFQRLVAAADLLLVDECDKAAANNYKELFFKHFTGRRKYGFSGTPQDAKKPVEWLFLRERLGSIIFHIPRKAVEATGRIIPVKCVMLAVGEDGDRDDKTAFDLAENEHVIKSELFHDLVRFTVESFPAERTLVIVDTHEIKSLGAALEQKIKGSKFIHGPTATKERRAAIKAFEEGSLPCLIGGKIIKRGLDLRGGVDNVILIGGGMKWSNIDQMVGRGVRRNSRGWCRIFGFYFMCNHYLYKHSREQLKAMIAMGYETTVVFSTGTVKGPDLIRSRFRIKRF